MNYTLDENQLKISRFLSQNNFAHSFYTIRCFIIVIERFYFFCKFNFLKVELEFEVYERDYFCNQFDCAKNIRILFFFLFFYMNDFELYRNFYRNFMIIYCQLIFLFFHDRMRRVNVFLITFDSHNNNLNEIIDVFQDLRRFDQKIILNLSKLIKVCVFIFIFLSDMFMQQINAKFKNQNANKKCRFCFIDVFARKDFDFDIIEQNRFHNLAITQKKQMIALRIKIERKRFANK